MAPDSLIREPDQIRKDTARKLRKVRVGKEFRALLGCLLRKKWTSPRLVQILASPDGLMIGRSEGNEAFSLYLGRSADLLKNIHEVAKVANLDGDEVGYLMARVAKIKRQR